LFFSDRYVFEIYLLTGVDDEFVSIAISIMVAERV
jgi:hypothetical protein